MNPILSSSRARIVVALAIICSTSSYHHSHCSRRHPKDSCEYAADPAPWSTLTATWRAASVSDAIEQLLHEKRYMSHRIQSIFPTKFAGKAITVKLVKQENP